MALELIGAGFGRTGTTSTTTALTTLGFRCQSMDDVFADLTQAALFSEAADDPSFDWERIFGNYTATIGMPACHFWRELVAAYPDAQVLLTVRDPDQWFDSYRATIYRPVALGWEDDPDGRWNEMARRVIVKRGLGGEPHDRASVIAHYERHNTAVREAIPADRLLVYELTEGWEPLCRFLGQPVPDEPFPRLNSRAEWRT